MSRLCCEGAVHKGARAASGRRWVPAGAAAQIMAAAGQEQIDTGEGLRPTLAPEAAHQTRLKLPWFAWCSCPAAIARSGRASWRDRPCAAAACPSTATAAAATAADLPPPRPPHCCPVWKAAAYGDFEKLRELAEADPDALHRPDEQGFFALQWAALNNRVAVLTYLLDRGCDVNATDGTGQSALHWATVRGSTAALETLLRAGADLAARDSRSADVCWHWFVGGCHLFSVLDCLLAPACCPSPCNALWGHRPQLRCCQWLPGQHTWRPMAWPHALLPTPAAGATPCATWQRSTARQPSCTTWRSSGALTPMRWTWMAARRSTGPRTRGLQVGWVRVQCGQGWCGEQGEAAGVPPLQRSGPLPSIRSGLATGCII